MLEALLRYAPASLRVVLVSRRDLPLNVRAAGRGRGISIVGEADLAFTAAEAGDALSRLPGAEVAAEEAVAATDGWVTGVLFEAWRSDEHVAGTGGEADPLHGYLSTQILDRLDDAQRELLVLTSPLRRVDAPSAARLGVAGAEAVLESLRRHHLPASLGARGSGVVLPPTVPGVPARAAASPGCGNRAAPAPQLRRAARGARQDEEATEAFFAAEAIEEALAVADRSIEGIVDRLDLDVAGRWLARVPPGELPKHPGLLTAQLMVAIGPEEYRSGRRAADALMAARTSIGSLHAPEPDGVVLLGLGRRGQGARGRGSYATRPRAARDQLSADAQVTLSSARSSRTVAYRRAGRLGRLRSTGSQVTYVRPLAGSFTPPRRAPPDGTPTATDRRQSTASTSEAGRRSRRSASSVGRSAGCCALADVPIACGARAVATAARRPRTRHHGRQDHERGYERHRCGDARCPVAVVADRSHRHG